MSKRARGHFPPRPGRASSRRCGPSTWRKAARAATPAPAATASASSYNAIAQAERLGKPLDQAFEEAWYIYTDTSPFPAVCGRVCPAPCETECNRKELDGAVNINKIERAIGDFGIEKGLKLKVLSEEKRPEKVAVVGGGPSGLSAPTSWPGGATA